MIYLLIVTIITSYAWGISEGITMIQATDRNYRSGWLDRWNAGARSHVWFGGYHFIDCIQVAGAMVIGWMLHGDMPSLYFLAGCLLVGWQCKEIGYSLSRWMKIYNDRERFNMFGLGDFVLTKTESYIITKFRVICGITLLIIGGFK
jgi:hypothetical protein